MVTAANVGEDAKVVALWREMLPFTMCVASLPYVSAVKAVCEILGHQVGPVRSPCPRLTAEQRHDLELHVRALDPAHFA
jgi:4-hydroxy-tetrahydrodipicolinate synthase